MICGDMRDSIQRTGRLGRISRFLLACCDSGLCYALHLMFATFMLPAVAARFERSYSHVCVVGMAFRT